MGRVIAIDGPSGAGKSTLAKMLADRLGFSYLDTGALYRAVALLFLSNGVRPEDDDEGLEEILRRSEVRMDNGRLMLNNKDVSTDIRTPEVGHYSSVFSARKVVRDFLLDVQRQTASVSDIVVEGRDTTTVIFPDAWKKFYMDAPVSDRARRRYLQLRQLGMDVTEEDAEKDVIERDNRDSKRDIAPLMKAGDAVIIDTTDKNIDEVLNCLLGACR